MDKARLPLVFRVLHWGVAIAVLLNAFVLEEGKLIHRYLGYVAVSLVLLRLLIHKKNPIDHYNPKAKYVYWSMWGAIIGLASTGFLMGLDRFFGNDLLEDIHEVFSNILIFLSVLHLGGVFFDAYKMKRKTWMLMISGEKD
ncbi:cytochrome b/b6 domain-containing protein [Halobacteriovorax sp. HFRX-2_2]|uniref:cytochrome b/b6 domain-containing protein n=1 Tax=unclassified Halobacteriovorax TaxID=2639665 RepID=UPI003712BC5A